MPFGHDTYVSPFSWRYGSQPMRHIWSEENRRLLMRQVWVALASAQKIAGLVTAEQLADLKSNVENLDIDRSLEIEREIHHDVMAELRTYADQCPSGGPVLHLGATSADITDNVDVLRMREALRLLIQRLSSLLAAFVDLIEETAGDPILAFTHIQPAEPTTLGYRLSIYAHDLLEDLIDLEQVKSRLRGKGFKGAVGTQASYQALLEGTGMGPEEMERLAMNELKLPYYAISTQVYPRRQDLRLINALAALASSIHKFGLDLRILQSPGFGEWSEPFGSKQVGSTAMPFKRNPVNAENICSLARYVATLPSVAWSNASQNVLERTLDDSANRRIVMAEAFLAVDELLLRTTRILEGLAFNRKSMAHNLARYGPFAATERLLMALVREGADRQDAHEWIRQASMAAWEALETGDENPLVGLLANLPEINQFFDPEKVRALLSVEGYTGTASQRARAFAQKLSQHLKGDE
ncbi:MAG: adenylosuccinate lyase [Anaerolineae bacterium]|nr:MAG: adenylosuccinate lyase [Anaerolineae bacterium]